MNYVITLINGETLTATVDYPCTIAIETQLEDGKKEFLRIGDVVVLKSLVISVEGLKTERTDEDVE
jgi:hypothetical protein